MVIRATTDNNNNTLGHALRSLNATKSEHCFAKPIIDMGTHWVCVIRLQNAI
eukprot:CAMPEP_0204182732 /NCGR_PEP_ID=MMETSP0361-20130328/52991_1 /ASSEMBLY_ACC=CAM_ASM_000343 /TAXON_ID=268821 /ORGANISM="Scrippsiella Hangoei, Strain SHTV-5" /LENGTH=51 /DNA_ID=CAMNT_0051142501 /DNA_START=605 /DNA_END=757 /DNA_ORIENTATION=+